LLLSVARAAAVAKAEYQAGLIGVKCVGCCSLSRWRERVRVRVGKLEANHEKGSRGALTPALSQRERE
jgi:hypothetical protein